MKPITKIIKEFEKIMPKTSTEGISYGHFCAIRDFVSNALKERDEAIMEMIEGMKKENEESEDYKSGEHWATYGYVKALDDLLDKIK